MNVPGRAEGNWSWRCTEELLATADFRSLRNLTTSSNRLPRPPHPAMSPDSSRGNNMKATQLLQMHN